MDETLAIQVRQRANHVCEYCHMPWAYYPTVPFPIDQPNITDESQNNAAVAMQSR